MNYELEFTDNAKAQIAFLKKSDHLVYSKLQRLLVELSEHPRTGTGKPKFEKRGKISFWVRRITDIHRLTYQIYDKEVIVSVLTTKGHYDDK